LCFEVYNGEAREIGKPEIGNRKSIARPSTKTFDIKSHCSAKSAEYDD